MKTATSLVGFICNDYENVHINQQLDSGRGWAGFYGQWLVELLSNIGNSVYDTKGTLEFKAVTDACTEYRKYIRM